MHRLSSLAPQALSVLRIAVALLFFEHGSIMLAGVPATKPGLPDPLPMLFVIGAGLEVLGGLLLALGLWTRWVAFVLSGEMAAAYFMFHAPAGFWPALNGGDAAILYCWIFAYLVFSGPGPWSLDAEIDARRRGCRPSAIAGAGGLQAGR